MFRNNGFGPLQLAGTTLWLVLVFSFLVVGTNWTVAQNPGDLPNLDAQTKAAIIDSITTALNEVYIFAD